MSILISPSNNAGWGLGTKRLYGGAQVRSEAHPVAVKSHYRAAWGSHKGYVPRARRRRPETVVVVRRRRRRLPMDPVTAAQVEATIDEVARNGPPPAQVVVAAPRRSTRYNLRTTRRLTPAGLAVLRMRARRLRLEAARRAARLARRRQRRRARRE